MVTYTMVILATKDTLLTTIYLKYVRTKHR